MQELNDALIFIDSFIGSAVWFPYFLLGIGVYFTIILKFPQIRFFKHAIRVVKGKYDDKNDEGDTSHFEALTTALSGTVGTGNIAGVAFAVFLGGPAAVFWMLATAAVGMCTKFVEVSLSHKYREKQSDGTMAGGPMYYMKNAEFKLGGRKFNLKWMAAIFAVATVLSSFGTGSLPQINSISKSLESTFGIDLWITGVVLGVLLALVIVGGIKRIAAVTSKLVPAMALIYLIGAFAVIFYNAENIIPSFISIFSSVFTGSAAVGGFLGAGISTAMNRGVNRGLFSNEAGQGSAPIAHASAKTEEPLSEGMVAILEPFIDTIIICTITAMVLLSSGVWNEKHENDFERTSMVVVEGIYTENSQADKEKISKFLQGEKTAYPYNGSLNVNEGKIDESAITFLNNNSFAEDIVVLREEEPFTGELLITEGSVNNEGLIIRGKSLIHSAPLTAIAFTRSFFGDFGQYIVSIGLLLFAFSTAISWSYYGDRAMTYLFGTKSVIYYRIVYVIGFILASFADTEVIWTLSAITIALMTLPNLVGIFWLQNDMKKTIREYGESFEKEFPDEKHPNFK
ncbi:MAG: amino acid carrier protein [Cyclobacteriaceae bacterium]